VEWAKLLWICEIKGGINLKIKMIKMASDLDENRNRRIWGIVPTEDKKYLLLEIGLAYSPDIKHTNLSSKEYSIKYPNKEYITMGMCFRVDLPEDYYNNRSKEFREYSHKSFLEYSYTNENITKVLQEFNPNIEGIELTDDYYIERFCEENGFFKLYDKRLEHNYEPLELFWIGGKNEEAVVKLLYTCYAVDGTIYQEEMKEKITIKDLVKDFGKDKIQELLEKNIAESSCFIQDTERKENYRKVRLELFSEIVNELNETNNLQKAAEIDELYDMDY